jgi:hypothetical protein
MTQFNSDSKTSTAQHTQEAIPLDTQDVEEVSASLRWLPPPPAYQVSPQLSRVVVIPQIEPSTLISGPMPFLRAWSPILQDHAITPRDFLSFIDGLAVAQAPSPPLQAVQIVSTGLGFVPWHWAQLASGGIGLAAGASTAAVSATRRKMYLKTTNTQFFSPRGLQVSVMSDEEMQLAARLPGGVPRLALADPSRGCVSITDRRMAAIAPFIAPLVVGGDLPAQTKPENVIDRLSAKQVGAKIRKSREKAEKKAFKQMEERDRGGRHGNKDGKGASRDEEDMWKRAGKLKYIVIQSLEQVNTWEREGPQSYGQQWQGSC